MQPFKTAIPTLARASRPVYKVSRAQQSWLSKPISRSLHFRASPILCEHKSRLYAPEEEGQEKAVKISRPQPSYELTFTCEPCSTRSSHRVSKQAYHNGSVLITCPGCQNRHLIADNLNIFGDRNTNIEDIMMEKGYLIKKGTLGENGDIEFWDDGTTTERKTLEDKTAEEETEAEGLDQAEAEAETAKTIKEVEQKPEEMDNWWRSNHYMRWKKGGWW